MTPPEAKKKPKVAPAEKPKAKENPDIRKNR